MSIETLRTMVCDGCQTRDFGSVVAMPRPLRKAAKEAGWKVGKKKDYCPACKVSIQPQDSTNEPVSADI